MTTDIPVKYYNETGASDFEVLVFTENFNPNTPSSIFAAWQVLKAQTSSKFVYPVQMEVGATYESGSQTIQAGPLPALLGSTWGITQPSQDATAVLAEVKGVPKNPEGAIVIKNNKPDVWSGRMFDIGVYKDKRLLVVQKDVRVLDQVDFLLKPKLTFAIARNIKVGDTFTSAEITSEKATFDLSEFPNGIAVTLKQLPGGGQYSFSADVL